MPDHRTYDAELLTIILPHKECQRACPSLCRPTHRAIDTNMANHWHSSKTVSQSNLRNIDHSVQPDLDDE